MKTIEMPMLSPEQAEKCRLLLLNLRSWPPRPAVDEPPHVPDLRTWVATAEVGRLMAVVPGAVATLLF